MTPRAANACASTSASTSDWTSRAASVLGALLFASALSLLGVAGAGCALRAPRADYSAYRAYRLADSPHDRSVAGAAYIESFPDGVYADEVRGALDLEEERFFASRRESVAGLQEYLRVYPDGRHAAAVRAELSALARREAASAAQREAQLREAEAVAADDLRAHRAWPREQLARFLAVLLRVQGWGAPIEDEVRRSPAFNEAFAASPRPICSATECVKTLRLAYTLPGVGGPPSQRSVVVEVVLRLDQERLMGAEIWLPGFGFSRWSELERRSVLSDEDPEQRREAVAWALSQIAPMLQEHLGGEARASEGAALPSSASVAPTLRLDTAGPSVDVYVADPQGADAGGAHAGSDGIVIGPAR